jgi:hypothetical protein
LLAAENDTASKLAGYMGSERILAVQEVYRSVQER